MRRSVAASSLLLALAAAAAVQAAPVEEFSFQLRDVKRDGRFTVAFTQRNYDTTGGVPVQPNEFFLRLPAGLKLRKPFLSKHVLCNTKRLGQTRNPKTCRRSQVGTGRVVVDARPFIADPIPANLWLFLAKGTRKKAVASLAILGKQDPKSPVVRDIPAVRDYRAPIVFMNVFDDPTPDGRYGYRLAFGNSPSGGGGASFTISETSVVTTGATLMVRKRVCARKRGGRCVRTRARRTRVFWLAPPKCPPSGKVGFLAFFGYETLPDVTRTTELSCPRFSL